MTTTVPPALTERTAAPGPAPDAAVRRHKRLRAALGVSAALLADARRGGRADRIRAAEGRFHEAQRESQMAHFEVMLTADRRVALRGRLARLPAHAPERALLLATAQLLDAAAAEREALAHCHPASVPTGADAVLVDAENGTARALAASDLAGFAPRYFYSPGMPVDGGWLTLRDGLDLVLDVAIDAVGGVHCDSRIVSSAPALAL